MALATNQRLRAWSAPFAAVRGDAFVAAAVTVLLLALNAPLLETPHFWDSLTFVAGAQALLANNFWPVLPTGEDYGHPVLLLEVLALAWRVFGDSILVSHLVIVGFASVAAYFTYRIGCALYGRAAGILAAGLLVFFPPFRAQSSLVLLDLPATSLSALAVYCLIKRRTGGFVLSASAMVLIKATSVVLLPVALAYIVLSDRHCSPRGGLIARLAAHAVPLLVLGCWFVFHLRMTGWISVDDNLGWLDVPAGLTPSSVIREYLPRMLFGPGGVVRSFIALGVSDVAVRFGIGVLTLAIAVYSARVRSVTVAWGGWATVTLLALPLVLHLALMALTTSLQRYLLPEYILFFIAAGRAVCGLAGGLRRLAIAFVAPVALFAIGWCVPLLGGSIESPTYGGYLDVVRADVDASAFLDAQYPSAIILAGWPQYVQLAMPVQGYARASHKVLAPIDQPRHAARLVALGGLALRDVARVTAADFDLVYISSAGHPPHVQLLTEIVERLHLPRIATFSSGGVVVHIYASAPR